MSEPLLSVVVPIYDVQAYLGACLDSILASTLTDLEVVCVDDGSTDASGAIADSYAERDARVRVVHVENGGLGRARNIGAELVSGRYLAFVDSDDLVTPHAYEMMCASLESSGSDIAAGRVRRLGVDRAWQSSLHTRAIPKAATRTHISKSPELVYDTTAWNKVFRRSFWTEHDLRFPEGVLYEDMPVTIPAHVLASSVDLLLDVVYEWRERGDGSLSITQRRSEVSNLRDRLAALEYVSDFLNEHGLAQARREHDRKVLTLDIPLYLGVLDVADDEFRTMFDEHMRSYLEHVDQVTLDTLDPWDRVAFALLQRGGLKQVVELVRERKAARNAYDVRRRGTRVYADLPFFDDDTQPVVLPRRVYEVTRRLPITRSVDDATIHGSALHVTGFALISKIALNRPWSALRFAYFRGKENKHRIFRPMWPKRSPQLAEPYATASASFDMAGFRVRVPLAKFRAPDHGSTTYFARVGFISRGRLRTAELARPRGQWMMSGADTIRPDGVLISVHTVRTGQLTVSATRDYALAVHLEADATGGQVTARLRLPDDARGAAATLSWQSVSHVQPLSAPLAADPADPTLVVGVVDVSSQRLTNPVAAQRVWRGTVDFTDASGRARSLPVVSDRPDPLLRHDDVDTHRQLWARVGAYGRLVLADRPVRVAVRSARWDGGRLVIEVQLPPAWPAERTPNFVLASTTDDRVGPAELTELPAEPAGGRGYRAVFDVLDCRARESLKPATWNLRTDAAFPGGQAWAVLDVDDAACRAGTAACDLPRAEVRIGPETLSVVVRANRIEDSGQFAEHRMQTKVYAGLRNNPLTDAVVFSAWGGKQFSDNPRALYEEMQRQGYDRPVIWVRRNTSVRMPDGVASVVMGSREYFEAIATARHVISNDAMPPYYVKRPGSRYLQTWHGTPLKRIGFDIENAQFGNVNYLDEFAVEVTKWDALISPNRFSTDIFRRAFAYSGPVLETGYPRNDVFYAPDVEDRRSAIRARLGISPGQRVILWAPTWREDQRDTRGRYSLALPFDPAAWAHVLRGDDILLFRGHQLLQETIGTRLQGLERVRNVTMYPDIQDLYLAADVLITDYSSVMFDFANTRRPMIFYAWDLDHYRDHLRGFYLDFEKTVPGPVVTNFVDLREVLDDAALVDTHADAYARFVEKFCGLEDGQASARVLKAFLDS